MIARPFYFSTHIEFKVRVRQVERELQGVGGEGLSPAGEQERAATRREARITSR